MPSYKLGKDFPDGRDRQFPSPFMDAASLAMPESMRDIFDLSQRVWYAAGTYRSAMERVVAYFMTDVNVGGLGGVDDELSEDERSKWEDFLRSRLDILAILSDAARNFLCYGNAFITPVVPFTRFVMCGGKDCSYSITHDRFTGSSEYRFSWSDYSYHGKCPSCNYSGRWNIHDVPGNVEEKIKFKVWPPQEIRIIQDRYSNNRKYFWKIPKEYIQDLRTGRNLEAIKNAPQPLLECARRNLDFEFSPDAIYHMQEPSLSGIYTGGWGIPRTLWHFRDIWCLQLLKKFNEAIVMDYLMPMRVLAPPPAASRHQDTDPLLSHDLGDFASHARKMVNQHRRDPASIHIFPMPIDYQILGGEANQLAPHELISQAEDALLNSAQVFAEFYRGTFNQQGAPGALRLFEAIWYPLRHEMDAFLRWVVNTLSDLLSWESVDCKLTKPRHADDLQRHMTLVQLMMSGMVSRTTGFKALDLDFEDEIRQAAEEADFERQQMQRVEEEAAQSQLSQEFVQQAAPSPLLAAMAPPPEQAGAMPGGAPAGGMPPMGAGMGTGVANGMAPPAGNMPMSPPEMEETAIAISQELLTMPLGTRRIKLNELKQQNEVLYEYVKGKMEEERQMAGTEGQQAVMQQRYGTT